MIRHQQRVVMLDQRAHYVGQLFSRRCAVFGKRHTTKGQNDFRENWLIDWQSSDGEGGPVRRMSVTDGPHVGPLAVNQEVHSEFARRATIVQRATFKISDGQQVFSISTLASHRRRRQHATVFEQHTNVAVRGDDVAALVHQLANTYEIASGGLFVHL